MSVCVSSCPVLRCTSLKTLTESFPGEVRFREGMSPKLMGQRL